MFRFSLIPLAFTAALLGPTGPAAGAPLDPARIESITGLTGTYNQTEDVFKVSKPRTDIKPAVDRWTLPPFMGSRRTRRSHRWAVVRL